MNSLSNTWKNQIFWLFLLILGFSCSDPGNEDQNLRPIETSESFKNDGSEINLSGENLRITPVWVCGGTAGLTFISSLNFNLPNITYPNITSACGESVEETWEIELRVEKTTSANCWCASCCVDVGPYQHGTGNNVEKFLNYLVNVYDGSIADCDGEVKVTNVSGFRWVTSWPNCSNVGQGADMVLEFDVEYSCCQEEENPE